MKSRIQIKQLEPKAYEAMMAMEKYLSGSSLELGLIELIKLRASQINGCAYCIAMHSEGALKKGEQLSKVFEISAWWASPFFSEKERSALAMTEEITLISNGGVSDTTFEAARAHFSENEIAQMIMLIGLINTWNRIAVSTHLFHTK